MAFTIRRIEQSGTTLGEKLRALRHDRTYNIEQVATATHLHPSIIEALESNDYCQLPQGIYSRQFLRTYIRFLGGDEQYFLECFEAERGSCDFVDPMLVPRQKVRRARFIVTPRILKFLSLSAAMALVLVYLGFQVHAIITPPTIEIISPTDGLSTDSAIVSVRGRVFEESQVSVNGESILLNKDGTFMAEVDLRRGLNLITVEAKKRYSNTSTEYLRVVLDEGSSVSVRR
jgi:cytoskeletal protein RodZ